MISLSEPSVPPKGGDSFPSLLENLQAINRPLHRQRNRGRDSRSLVSHPGSLRNHHQPLFPLCLQPHCVSFLQQGYRLHLTSGFFLPSCTGLGGGTYDAVSTKNLPTSTSPVCDSPGLLALPPCGFTALLTTPNPSVPVFGGSVFPACIVDLGS